MRKFVHYQTHVLRDENQEDFYKSIVTIIHATDEDGKLWKKIIGEAYHQEDWQRLDDYVPEMGQFEN